MNEIMQYLQSLMPDGFDFVEFLTAAGILIGAFLLLGGLGRLLFGRKSALNMSISTAIGILFIYALTVAIHSYGLNLDFLVSPLPFIQISGEYLHIFDIAGADYAAICGQVLNMVILAFLANLVNSWLPQGKKLLGWFFFRILSVAVAMLLHALVSNLLTAFLPEGLLTWAPVILLWLLVIMLAVGALKFLVGLLLSTVNPLIGFLYTFFFANAIGKQLTRSMLTTLLFCIIVYVLNYAGISTVFIASAALAAYLPFLVILVVLWYIIGHKL